MRNDESYCDNSHFPPSRGLKIDDIHEKVGTEVVLVEAYYMCCVCERIWTYNFLRNLRSPGVPDRIRDGAILAGYLAAATEMRGGKK